MLKKINIFLEQKAKEAVYFLTAPSALVVQIHLQTSFTILSACPRAPLIPDCFSPGGSSPDRL